MRNERGWWLLVFCFLSLCIHIGIGLKSPAFTLPTSLPGAPREIEVALEPLKEPTPTPKPASKPQEKPAPKPERSPAPKPERRSQPSAPARRDAAPAVQVAERGVPFAPQPRVRTDEPRPTAPRAEPGGAIPNAEEKPLPLGLPTGRPEQEAPRLQRLAKADAIPGGGGSPAPGPVLGGRGGAPGPEAPPEDIIFHNGGGAGGMKLPQAAPRIGGGGGRSELSVQNPLAKTAIPEDKPGLGPGLGGGAGAGGGGGVGYGRGQGIGTRLDGVNALASLRRKPGSGIGAGKGRGIGTRPPGGGRGTGAELPGTGGTGVGYGRGSGIGVGAGRGRGVGDGGGSGGSGLSRGIPFGDITGLLRGDPKGGGGRGGGPGGPGRGSVFGRAPAGGGRQSSAAVHMVYVIDISLSMREGNKMRKAQEALKKAISELKRRDTFNIVTFCGDIDTFSPEMLAATPENVREATEFVDSIRMGYRTNISAALEMALSQEKATHVFLLSDGEPTTGIVNSDDMRAAVREWNRPKARIITLALGLGEEFRGMPLLKALAEDNNGKFDYINLAK